MCMHLGNVACAKEDSTALAVSFILDQQNLFKIFPISMSFILMANPRQPERTARTEGQWGASTWCWSTLSKVTLLLSLDQNSNLDPSIRVMYMFACIGFEWVDHVEDLRSYYLQRGFSFSCVCARESLALNSPNDIFCTLLVLRQDTRTSWGSRSKHCPDEGRSDHVSHEDNIPKCTSSLPLGSTLLLVRPGYCPGYSVPELSKLGPIFWFRCYLRRRKLISGAEA